LDEEQKVDEETAAQKRERQRLRRKEYMAATERIDALEAQVRRNRASLGAAWFAFLIALLTATMPMLPELMRMLFDKLKP
jgi:Na+/proline symporter